MSRGSARSSLQVYDGWPVSFTFNQHLSTSVFLIIGYSQIVVVMPSAQKLLLTVLIPFYPKTDQIWVKMSLLFLCVWHSKASVPLPLCYILLSHPADYTSLPSPDPLTCVNVFTKLFSLVTTFFRFN